MALDLRNLFISSIGLDVLKIELASGLPVP
jgi:hypothetical protein